MPDTVREDFLDFPTAWRIQNDGVEHADPRCSALQTSGGMLCDCGAWDDLPQNGRDAWCAVAEAAMGSTGIVVNVTTGPPPGPSFVPVLAHRCPRCGYR